MRIKGFCIQNYRSICCAEADDLPNLIVVCGPNGCGKSSLLEAIVVGKEYLGSYLSGGGQLGTRTRITAGQDSTRTELTFEFSPSEREFLQRHHEIELPPDNLLAGTTEIRARDGGCIYRDHPKGLRELLSHFEPGDGNDVGCLKYFSAERRHLRRSANKVLAGQAKARERRALITDEKFIEIKGQLANLKIRHLQAVAATQRTGQELPADPLDRVRHFFEEYLAPLRFDDVHVDTDPYRFVVKTPDGEIDLDDLSSGEKEILYTFINLDGMKNSIILIDEVDAHLHPELQRRFFAYLKEVAEDNQVWLTTHSPAVVRAASDESLFALAKAPPGSGQSQFRRIAGRAEQHEVLCEIMGERGMLSFGGSIIFIEGRDASADKAIYERLYPPEKWNVSFVPVGSKADALKAHERINVLLSSCGPGFQQFFSIVDGDTQDEPPQHAGNRAFRLPVYHVENFLLDEAIILQEAERALGGRCTFDTQDEVVACLKKIVDSENHVCECAKALLDARRNGIAAGYRKALFKEELSAFDPVIPELELIKKEVQSKMSTAVDDGSWKALCKGRTVLGLFCGEHNLKYEQFRNCLISAMETPPRELAEIMIKILS